MTAGSGVEAADLAAQKLRVFLSYSRRDSEFVARLASALEARGYLPDFDRSTHDKDNVTTGISAEDDWWKRLQEMIEAADVMVFVVSPDSAASRVCDEEIVYARSLGKRVIPLLRREIDFATAPPRLAALNVKICIIGDDAAAFDGGVAALSTALDRDVAWLREQTRLILAAADWEKSGRRDEELLHGAEISEAEAWSARRPPAAPEVSEQVLAFLGASRNAQAAREDKERRSLKRQRALQRWVGGLIVVALAITAVGGWYVVERQRELARQTSRFLATEAASEAVKGRMDAAMRIGVLAARTTWLAPAAPEGEWELGKAADASRLIAVLPMTDAALVEDADGAEAASQSASGIVVAAGGNSKASDAVFSPDGSQVAAAFQDGSVRLWSEKADGAWTGDRLTAAMGDVRELAWSPDGKLLAAGAASGELRIWRMAADEPARVDVRGRHTDTITVMAFSPTGKTLLTGGNDFMMRVWRADGDGGWRAVGEYSTAHQTFGLSFAGDTRVLLAGSGYEAPAIWNESASGEWIMEPAVAAQGHSGGFFAAGDFFPDGQGVVTGSGAGDLRLWRRNDSGLWASEKLAGHDTRPQMWVTSVQVSRDGRRIVTASEAGDARVWQLSEGGWTSVAVLEGVEARVFTAGVEFSPDGRSVLSGAAGGAAMLWTEDALGKFSGVALGGHDGDIQAVHFSADASRVVTASSDGGVRVWSAARLSGAEEIALKGHPTRAYSAAYAPDGSFLVSGSWDKDGEREGGQSEGTARVWRRGGGGEWTSDVLQHPDWVKAIAVSPDATRVATAIYRSPGSMRIWRRNDAGEWIAQVVAGDYNTVASLAFAMDGRILTGGDDGVARIWAEAADGSWSGDSIGEFEDRIESVTFSRDGRFALAGSGGLARMWASSDDGKWSVHADLDHGQEYIKSVAFSPDGAQVLTATDRGRVRIWTSTKGGVWGAEQLSGHTEQVNSVAFSPDGKRVLTTSDRDRTTRLWARDMDGVWASVILFGADGEAGAGAAAFSPDGMQVATAWENGVVKLRSIDWLTGDSGRALAQARGRAEIDAMISAVCRQRLAGNSLLTTADTDAAPILRGREGEDVCAWRPAWYDRVLDSALGWMR